MKKLEGLDKLLKAAGVKPAGAEAMVRDHLDEIKDDERHHGAELIPSVKTLEAELVELQQKHASSVSVELFIKIDLSHALARTFRSLSSLGTHFTVLLAAVQEDSCVPKHRQCHAKLAACRAQRRYRRLWL